MEAAHESQVHYYIVENTYPARADFDTWKAELLSTDGVWNPDNFEKVTTEGREVPESDVMTFWERHAKSGRFAAHAKHT